MGLRITSGRLRGRSIPHTNQRIRPTQDKVKEALFSILGLDIQEANFLDLFCGTGAVLFEALSRGCARAVGVDREPSSAMKNRQVLGLDDAVLIRRDVLKSLPELQAQGECFSIVFIDPPYDYDLKLQLLMGLGKFDILETNCLVVIETRHDEALPANIDERLICEKIYNYGYSKLTKYRFQ